MKEFQNHKKTSLFFLTITLLLIKPISGYAYVGPGLGAGTIGVILGLLGSIFLAIFAVFWYPIKRAIFGDEDNQEEDDDNTEKPELEPEPEIGTAKIEKP